MRERDHHRKAFEFYFALGEDRSYKQVAKEFGVSLGTVKLWGRSFRWKARVGERDAEIARAMADRSMKDGIDRGERNRKIIEMGLVQVARAIAEGKVRITVSDLDRLIRLEEYLREEVEPRHKRIVVVWGGRKGQRHEADSESGLEGE